MNTADLAPVVVCCTECRHVYQPSVRAALESTGCERCGGWTWIAQSIPVELPQQPPIPSRNDREQARDSAGIPRGTTK
jgi:hypothetical protein